MNMTKNERKYSRVAGHSFGTCYVTILTNRVRLKANEFQQCF